MRLFALLLQEQPLQCKEKAAYLMNYRQEIWEGTDSLVNRRMTALTDQGKGSHRFRGGCLFSTAQVDKIPVSVGFRQEAC